MRSIDQQTSVALADYLTRAAELVKSGLAKSPSNLGNIASGLMAVARDLGDDDGPDDKMQADYEFGEGECLGLIDAELLNLITRDNADWWEGIFAKMSFRPEQVRG